MSLFNSIDLKEKPAKKTTVKLDKVSLDTVTLGSDLDTVIEISKSVAPKKVETKVVELKSIALGIVRNEDLTYSIIRVNFNRDGTTCTTQEVAKASSASEAEYLFKTNTVKQGIFE